MVLPHIGATKKAIKAAKNSTVKSNGYAACWTINLKLVTRESILKTSRSISLKAKFLSSLRAGKLLTLPVGSTADFAFAVHTDVGLHALAVKINGHIAPLKAVLTSGDLVEVIVSPNQKPNPDWLQFVKTSRARNKIKKWLKEQHFEVLN